MGKVPKSSERVGVSDKPIKKRHRRTAKEIERTHFCHCGKGYGSEASLLQHVRLKHSPFTPHTNGNRNFIRKASLWSPQIGQNLERLPQTSPLLLPKPLLQLQPRDNTVPPFSLGHAGLASPNSLSPHLFSSMNGFAAGVLGSDTSKILADDDHQAMASSADGFEPLTGLQLTGEMERRKQTQLQPRVTAPPFNVASPIRYSAAGALDPETTNQIDPLPLDDDQDVLPPGMYMTPGGFEPLFPSQEIFDSFDDFSSASSISSSASSRSSSTISSTPIVAPLTMSSGRVFENWNDLDLPPPHFSAEDEQNRTGDADLAELLKLTVW